MYGIDQMIKCIKANTDESTDVSYIKVIISVDRNERGEEGDYYIKIRFE